MLATHNNEKKRSIKPKQRRRKKAQKSGASIGVVEKMVFHHSENKDGDGVLGGLGKNGGDLGVIQFGLASASRTGLEIGDQLSQEMSEPWLRHMYGLLSY